MGPAPVDTVTAPRVAPDALGGQAGELPTPLAFAERSAPGALARLALPPPPGAPTAGASPRAWERAARSRVARSRSLALVSPGRTTDRETTHLQMDPVSSASRLFSVCPPTQPKDRERKRAGRKGEKKTPTLSNQSRALFILKLLPRPGRTPTWLRGPAPAVSPAPRPSSRANHGEDPRPLRHRPRRPGPAHASPGARDSSSEVASVTSHAAEAGGARRRSVYQRWFGSLGRRALLPKCTCRRLCSHVCACVCSFTCVNTGPTCYTLSINIIMS